MDFPNKSSLISFYPNPFSTQTTLETDSLINNATLNIADIIAHYNAPGYRVSTTGTTIVDIRKDFYNNILFNNDAAKTRYATLLYQRVDIWLQYQKRNHPAEKL